MWQCGLNVALCNEENDRMRLRRMVGPWSPPTTSALHRRRSDDFNWQENIAIEYRRQWVPCSHPTPLTSPEGHSPRCTVMPITMAFEVRPSLKKIHLCETHGLVKLIESSTILHRATATAAFPRGANYFFWHCFLLFFASHSKSHIFLRLSLQNQALVGLSRRPWHDRWYQVRRYWVSLNSNFMSI